MKKLMTTAVALAMLAGFVSAQVESANVVGYSTIAFKQGYNLVGVQFEKVGGGTIDIQDLFDDLTLKGLDDEANFFDFISAWDLEAGAFTATFYWCDNPTLEIEDTWLNSDLEPATHPFQSGDAFWLYTELDHAGATPGAGVAVGQVAAANQPITLLAGYNLLSSPFPVDLELNGGQMTVDGLVGLDDEANFYDFISAWDLAAGAFTATYYWCDNPNLEIEDTWLDSGLEPTTDAIAPNTAFWLYHNGTGATVTFNTPL